MNIHIADACGFCYGVKRAVQMAKEAAPGTNTLGPIIHNPQVVNKLSERGVCPIVNLDEAAEGSTLLIRSHDRYWWY